MLIFNISKTAVSNEGKGLEFLLKIYTLQFEVNSDLLIESRNCDLATYLVLDRTSTQLTGRSNSVL